MAKCEEYAMVKALEIFCGALVVVIALVGIAMILPPPNCTLVPYNVCYDVAHFTE